MSEFVRSRAAFASSEEVRFPIIAFEYFRVQPASMLTVPSMTMNGTVDLRQGPGLSSISTEARTSGIALYPGMFPSASLSLNSTASLYQRGQT
jgi:hypothetical protein